MILFLDGHDMGYEMGNLCFLFFPGEKLETAAQREECRGDFALTRLKRLKGRACAYVTICRGGRRARAVSYTAGGGDPGGKDCEAALGRAFYKAASRLCGFRPPWGVLTGIRPARVVREWQGRGMAAADIKNRLIQDYYVSGNKAELCVKTALAEEKILELSGPASVSLYISIPFCPTRCLYCSFISADIEKNQKLLPQYVGLLCEELAETARLIKTLGLRLETIYMGGGTPTALPADALEKIFETVRLSFDLASIREYTVEAGRPDTITAEKLKAIQKGGASRICINPQTLDDDILKRIGRSHTSRQFFEAFRLAREAGIGSINTDLIAGLPGDTAEGFAKTLEGVMALAPESVTVHTLAVKRSSRLVTGGEVVYDARGEAANAMIERASGSLESSGYMPYYLYRQRNTTGNLENVGYARAGHECLYNVFIMDETHTILSTGAGGVTKLRQPSGSRIERIFNFKYPFEYITRFSEILARKKQVLNFYDDYSGKSENITVTGE